MLSKRAKTGNLCRKIFLHTNTRCLLSRKSRDVSLLHPLQNKSFPFTVEFSNHSDNVLKPVFASAHRNPHPSGNNPRYRPSPYRRSINNTVPLSVSVRITLPAACTTF